MLPTRSKLSEGPQVSNRLGDTGGISVAWPTMTHSNDESNERASTNTKESIIARVVAIAWESMTTNSCDGDVDKYSVVVE